MVERWLSVVAYCIGLNDTDHAMKVGLPLPDQLVVFMQILGEEVIVVSGGRLARCPEALPVVGDEPVPCGEQRGGVGTR